MKCDNCSKDIPDESVFCSYCGIKFNNIKNNKVVRDEINVNDIGFSSKRKIYLIIGLILICCFVIYLLIRQGSIINVAVNFIFQKIIPTFLNLL